ncbi:hypothetical protein DL98DRAFT_572105 [Cadophora sp. DSE1049]|nr:hypothetical protein DL98DRAFT_572105 [Cadophora sp. DSE1049]
MQGSDFESRKHFLEYRSGSGPSIMDAFLTSRQRLRDPDGISWNIMQFSAFLETGDPSLDFRRFFYAISRDCMLQPSDFPDHDVLIASKVSISEAFADIEVVLSVYGGSKSHQIHALGLDDLPPVGVESR